MITAVALLTARAGLDHEAFVEHYENHHVPLVLGLAPAPERYVRHYLPPRDRRQVGADFDVVTITTFTDDAARREWLGRVLADGSGVVEDETRFLDRSRTRSWIVDEHDGDHPRP